MTWFIELRHTSRKKKIRIRRSPEGYETEAAAQLGAFAIVEHDAFARAPGKVELWIVDEGAKWYLFAFGPYSSCVMCRVNSISKCPKTMMIQGPDGPRAVDKPNYDVKPDDPGVYIENDEGHGMFVPFMAPTEVVRAA